MARSCRRIVTFLALLSSINSLSNTHTWFRSIFSTCSPVILGFPLPIYHLLANSDDPKFFLPRRVSSNDGTTKAGPHSPDIFNPPPPTLSVIWSLHISAIVFLCSLLRWTAQDSCPPLHPLYGPTYWAICGLHISELLQWLRV